jgi:lysophospholipase L1-like esterase
LAALAALVLAGGCGEMSPAGDASPVAPTPSEVPMRFLALGDSYTIGEGVAAADRWPVQLARLMRAEGITLEDPIIIATTGWTTDELADAIARKNPQGPYDLVSLLIGVNNQYRGRDLKEYRAQFVELLTQAITLAGGDPKRVLVLSIPDWGVTPFAANRHRETVSGQINAFNAVNAEETARLGARYVDITPISRQAADDRSLLAGDGLHPSGKMYALWSALALPEALAAIDQ